MKKPDVSLKEMEGNKITENFDYIFDVNVKRYVKVRVMRTIFC